MHALIQTVAFRSIDTILVNFQVHIANALLAISVVRVPMLPRGHRKLRTFPMGGCSLISWQR
jgi:hypothetical protein